MNSKHNIVIICGSTASGKTNLALQLARELPRANILSVDSRQVYGDLSIITGKDVPTDLPSSITFFGHDLYPPNKQVNLADFVRYSQKIIQDSYDTKTPLIIVGGTGLYLKALTTNLSLSTIPPNKRLRHALEKLSLSNLQDRLQKIDHKKYSTLNHSDIMNPRRLIRAIEIASYPVKSRRSEASPFINQLNFFWVGLRSNKENLKTAIHNRVLARLRQGAVAEVKKLLQKFPNKTLPIYSSLGVSTILEYLENNLTKQQLIEKWSHDELDYARRQIVWFKKQPLIVWYDKDIDKKSLAQKLSKIYLKNA